MKKHGSDKQTQPCSLSVDYSIKVNSSTIHVKSHSSQRTNKAKEAWTTSMEPYQYTSYKMSDIEMNFK